MPRYAPASRKCCVPLPLRRTKYLARSFCGSPTRHEPAEVVEGRASPEGNTRQAAVVRTPSRETTSIRLAAVRRTSGGFKPHAADVRPEGGARCVSSARRDLCGGRGAILVPTATADCASQHSRSCCFARGKN